MYGSFHWYIMYLHQWNEKKFEQYASLHSFHLHSFLKTLLVVLFLPFTNVNYVMVHNKEKVLYYCILTFLCMVSTVMEGTDSIVFPRFIPPLFVLSMPF
ncbi:hypothetical protein K450DRAFT_240776 [Umbelopsis ramanniana AG]|uniref:Uncharacterized protein n=1 Tax=Umbelopsis ramanniana AG TaxID=1314678 RepID=A0AAD5ECD4_UMBRA|nr:uncharacterized protein K450DRAFT_240776 [Umbelopsis ramanniana AG]KAI8579640.1 hypothetical protein K450DRAFT_240776 [Umbelopsis ramanniana AG]